MLTTLLFKKNIRTHWFEQRTYFHVTFYEKLLLCCFSKLEDWHFPGGMSYKQRIPFLNW